MHCLANTIEPLRAANSFAGRKIYDWRFLSLDGGPVTSSSGLLVAAHEKLADHRGEMLVVMPSYRFLEHASGETARALRAAASRHEILAGFDTGSWLLAAAGLLAGRKATIHWEEIDRFAEAFPDVEVIRARHVIDGNRITCGGALTAFELVMELIGQRHGEALRLEVATMMSPQSAPSARGRSVARAVALMQENLEAPLPIGEIARRVGRRQKELESRMKAELGATPQAVYRRLRLILARKLVIETDLGISEIALRTGYQDPAAMTRAFKAEFGLAPRSLRAN